MQGVQTTHPPGMICFASGEIARYADSLACLTRLQAPAGSSLAFHMGVLVAENLNKGVTAMMEQPALQWAWIMGDDHLYAHDLLLRLLDAGVDAVAPLCLNRYPPLDPSIVSASAGRQKWLEELPTAGLYKLAPDETCGDAGLLIRRVVLEALERPFYDRLRSGSFKSEDQAFTRKVQAAGFAIWIDVEHVLGHIAAMNVRPVVKDGRWHVRLTGGQTHVVDLAPKRVPA